MKKVAILYGGPSNEHEVSIESAQNILKHIDRGLFNVVEVFINKNGYFLIDDGVFETSVALDKLKKKGVDVIFPVLHGSFGEDGKLQKILEERKMLFVGSGSISSAKAIDKNIANDIYKENNLLTPLSQPITQADEIKILFPIIVKPIDEGSSRGIYKIQNNAEYQVKKSEIFKGHKTMLAQEFVLGREFTCGVVEISGKIKALPASEIVLKKSETFDYDVKYTLGACLEITPADVTNELMNDLQNSVLKCHEILGCRSISRTDMMVSSDNKIYILETNTLPGMTKTSFIPAQAKAYGLEMGELLSVLIDSAHI